MTTHGTLIAPDTLRFERVLSASLETVWAYLVEPEKRALWLAGGETDGRLGGAVTLVFENARHCHPGEETPEKYKHLGEISTMVGTITAFDPPRLLSYTWVEPDEGIAEDQPSEVTFELTPQGEQTRLVLTHRRLPKGEVMKGVAAGWHTHLDIFVDHLAGTQPKSFWSTHMALEDVYHTKLGLG